VFWVVSVYFNIRNTLPKSGTFLLGHPVYIVYTQCLSTQELNILPDECVHGVHKILKKEWSLGTAVAQRLRCCATNRKVAGSIPDGVIGIFH